MRARHEKTVLLDTAERQIGTTLRKADEANGLSFRIEHLDAVQFLAFGVWRTIVPKAAPKVAVGIDPHSVESSGSVGIDEFDLVRQRHAVGADIIRPDQPVGLCP